jgi:hypothetical protein
MSPPACTQASAEKWIATSVSSRSATKDAVMRTPWGVLSSFPRKKCVFSIVWKLRLRVESQELCTQCGSSFWCSGQLGLPSAGSVRTAIASCRACCGEGAARSPSSSPIGPERASRPAFKRSSEAEGPRDSRSSSSSWPHRSSWRKPAWRSSSSRLPRTSLKSAARSAPSLRCARAALGSSSSAHRTIHAERRMSVPPALGSPHGTRNAAGLDSIFRIALPSSTPSGSSSCVS